MRIAISGLSGCGNTTTCNNVSKALKLKVVNYTLRNLAQDMGMTLEEMLEKRKDDPQYDYMLDRKQIDLVASQDNTILGSRLSCWLIYADLKVWLEAPLRERAARIAHRESREYYDVLVETKKRDEEDIAAYKRLYGINIQEHDEIDLTINTERFNAAEVCEIVTNAARVLEERQPKSNKYTQRILDVLASKLGGK